MPVRGQRMLYRGVGIVLRRVTHTDAHAAAAPLAAETSLGLAEHLHRQFLLLVELQFPTVRDKRITTRDKPSVFRAFDLLLDPQGVLRRVQFVDDLFLD